MAEGWIKVYRKILDSPLWKDSNSAHRDVILTLLLMVNHKENEWFYNGKKYKCKAGQVVTSLESIRAKCGKGTSKLQVRRALEKFESDGFLIRQPTHTSTLITIVNWDLYQGAEDKPTQVAIQHRHSTDTAPTPNKNVRMKECKNNIINTFKNSIPDSDENLIEAFKGFVDMRNRKKKPLTDRAVKTLCNKLIKLSKGNIGLMVDMLDRSTVSCWMTVYELGEDDKNYSKDQKYKRLDVEKVKNENETIW